MRVELRLAVDVHHHAATHLTLQQARRQAQQFGQNQQEAALNNSAQNQKYGQMLSSGQFANDATSRAFDDSLAAAGQNYGQQAKTLAKELNRDNESGDQVKQARAREIAERFKEKAARDREQSRSFSR